ncbi:MAG: tripartite tricarboxylate transporter substrate binding protein [Clostridia bacterium]
MKKLLSILLTICLCLSITSAALAAYPEKEITYLCGYGAGGSSDLQARLMQPYAEEYLGAPLVVENVTGAGGAVGLNTYATYAPDGYAVSSFNTTPLLYNVYGTSDFDYFDKFDFLCCVITTPIVVAVTADSPYQTIEDLIAAATKDPEKLMYASAGAGSITHLAGELWQYKAGIKFTHVPFNGGADAMTGLLNKSVDFEVVSLSEVLTKHEEGSLRILASCTNQKLLGTDGKTELAIPVLDGCNVKVIQGVCVLKDTDPAIKTKLAEGFGKICNDERYLTDMQKAGYAVDYMDSETFTKYLKDTAAEFKTLLDEADLWDEVA